MEASEAEAKIAATKTETARAAAIEAAPHLDALDPYAAAMAWAKGDQDETIDPASDRRLDPETQTAATSASGIPPNVEINDVRRQGFWNQWQLNLRESSAHLVGLIMRRVVCDASAVLRVSFV